MNLTKINEPDINNTEWVLVQIKYCPKCGGSKYEEVVDVVPVGDYKDHYIVRCSRCGYTAAHMNEAMPTVEKAIRLWNERIMYRK